MITTNEKNYAVYSHRERIRFLHNLITGQTLCFPVHDSCQTDLAQFSVRQGVGWMAKMTIEPEWEDYISKEDAKKLAEGRHAAKEYKETSKLVGEFFSQ